MKNTLKEILIGIVFFVLIFSFAHFSYEATRNWHTLIANIFFGGLMVVIFVCASWGMGWVTLECWKELRNKGD